MKEEKIDTAYKKWLDNLQESPPEEVWANIHDSLDVADVWVNIYPKLPAQPLYVPTLLESIMLRLGVAGRLAVAVTLLVLLTTPLPVTTRDTDNSENISHNSAQPLEGQRKKSEALGEEKTPSIKSHEKTLALRNKSKYNAHTRDNGAARGNGLLSYVGGPLYRETFPESDDANFRDTAPASDGNAISPNDAELTTIIPVTASDVVQRPVLKIPDTPESGAPQKEKFLRTRDRFAAGLIYSFNNVWLLNNKTLEGLNSSTLVKTEATYGQEAGAFIRVPVRNASIQIEYYTLSQTGQRYKEYINALYQDKSIQLQYNKVQVLYRRSILNSGRFMSTYGLGGIFLSRLQSARETIGGDYQLITNEFSNYDYGLTLGIESELRINPRLYAVPGIRARYSTHNISRDNNASAPRFNTPTYSAAIGASFALKYKF